ncbi:hypothetical protein PN498_14040 [Oscillatoria sp. CS-180]|uniref:hypothetical protein n=1 Tax=Oscillatoria sp. CS-180 TaxID=3021720 RepID=UPI0023307326|nr:hypothetical protein [Oscillatoria sp. CS-180]MDB9527118.1 hypothetical protein [Oscillatoria sp. CS-180]
MRPMLDDIELPQVQEITVHDQRTLAEHKPPGMSGSLLQNLGRRPTCLLLWGVTTGPEADTLIEQLDDKFRAGTPVTFIADIVTDSAIEQVIIDNLQVQDLAGKPLRYGYVLTLREYIEPVKPEDVSALNSDILDDALDAIDSITDALGFTDQLSQFIGQLNGLNEDLRRQDINSVTDTP